MGLKRTETFAEIFRWGLVVELTCDRCGHKGRIDNFLHPAFRNKWIKIGGHHRMARPFLVCTQCGARGPTMRVCSR